MLVSGRVNICVAEDWNVPGVPVSRKTMTSFKSSRTLSRAWCTASDTHVFPGDILVKLSGGTLGVI